MDYKNYSVVFEKDVKDLSSRALLLKHDKTGARIFILSNDDDNKVFYIGFRTPPSDDTGVAHIMEHSVLCGSEKYPLKDPFVELVKGSMNSFLNAMTFPDKTVYPVASTNDKDFKNLMSVYMDAVLKPNVYKYPQIMKQEGWSYKLDSAEDDIEYNGVVYNEMKGAFSSPESVLDRETLHALFPDNAYGFESGGAPESIPDLTYERFLDFHRTYYHPSNCYIYLYGNMVIEERLKWLDEAYLSSYERIDVDSEIRDQKSFTGVKTVIKPYAVSSDEPLDDNTYLSFNIRCGDNLDPLKYYAMQMIQYALVETQGAPVRQKLLDEGIGKDIISSFETGLRQEYFSIVSRNANSKDAERFLKIINDEFKKAAENGINKRSLEASLNSLEFKYKEADFGGFPKGLVYGLNALDSWLYDDQNPLLHIECSDTFSFLRNSLNTDYYEELVKTWLLGSNDAAMIILEPSRELSAERDRKIAEKLERYKSSLSKDEIEKLIEDTNALKAYQEQEDTEEQKLSIPMLSREDIKREAVPFSNTEEEVEGIKVVRHDHNTNGIAYAGIFFDSNMIPFEKLKYLSLLRSVISYVDTDNYSYSELNDEINIKTGGLSMETGVYCDRYDDSSYSVLSDLSFRALYGNIEDALRFCAEVILRSRFDDYKRLYEIIAELKSKLQMSLSTSGHIAAAMRAESYFSEAACVKEQINGFSFYKFVESLEKNFDSEKEKLAEELKEIIDTIISPSNMIISFTGTDEGYMIFKEALKGFLDDIANKTSCSKIPGYEDAAMPVKDRRYKPEGIELRALNEGLKTSSAVQYVAKAGRYGKGKADYTGSIKVMLTIMRFDYLWFNIRVQGGAYGCMCSASSDGICNFVSYRDPNLKRTLEVYDEVPAYLESFDADEREMTKYVIGTMSSVDNPLTPALKGARDMAAYLNGTKFEDVQKARNEIIDTSAEDIRKLAPLFREALLKGCICVLGKEARIEEDREIFGSTLNVFE